MQHSVRPSSLNVASEARSSGSPVLSLIIRSTVFNILFYINIVALMTFGLPSVLMGRHAAMFMAKLWARTSIWLLKAICGVTTEFRGVENIPRGGVVIAAKHQSLFETFALIVHVPDFAYVFKRELNWIPLFGWYLKAVEQIAIDRASGSTALVQVTEGVESFLEDGRAILIFPEGTRRPVGAPPRYKHGVSHIYATLNARVVPVALNTGLFWPRRSFLRRPGVATIEFLPPIEPGLSKEDFAELLQETIESKTDELVADAIGRDATLAWPVKTLGPNQP
jgi:1-acyl-sn-glycerol-3-phosphate acyltransferase